MDVSDADPTPQPGSNVLPDEGGLLCLVVVTISRLFMDLIKTRLLRIRHTPLRFFWISTQMLCISDSLG